MPGIADLFSSSAPTAQPVQNATQWGMEQQNQNTQNLLRQTQAAQGAQDIGLKQRQMQLSMLNGVLALPPEKQGDALSHVVPMMNRLGPTQFDEGMTPETAKMYVMSQVPAEQIPQFGLNQQMANMARVVQDRLSGGAQPPAAVQPSAPAGSGTPMPQGTPMPANGAINPTGAAPVPAGGGNAIDPQTLALMATLPGYDKAAQTINEIQNQSPGGKAQAEYQTKSAGKLSDLDATENLLKTSIGQMQTALEPDPALGGKSPAEVGVGGFAPEIRAKLGMQMPKVGSFVGADPISGLAYEKLQTLLNPEAGEEAKSSFNRVTGQEFKTFQSSQGLDVPPEQRPEVIKTAIAQAQKKLAAIQSQRAGLQAQSGVNAPPSTNSPSNAQEHFDTIQNAKAAIAKGAPPAAVRQRLMDAGIDPAKAGM